MNLNTITMNFNVRVINLFSVLCKMFKIFVISGSIFHIKFDFLLLYGSSLLQTYTSFAEPLVIFTNTGVQITVRTQLNFIHLKPKNITFYFFIRWTHSSLFREQLIFFHLDFTQKTPLHSKTHLMFTNFDDHLGTSRQFMSSYKTK